MLTIVTPATQPQVEDLDIVHNQQRRARRISIGTMCLTVLFMICMLRTMHTALRDIRAKDAPAAGENV